MARGPWEQDMAQGPWEQDMAWELGSKKWPEALGPCLAPPAHCLAPLAPCLTALTPFLAPLAPCPHIEAPGIPPPIWGMGQGEQAAQHREQGGARQGPELAQGHWEQDTA